MNRAIVGCLLAVGIGMSCAGAQEKLEVHEWGTFTVFSGSDGNLLRWYLPYLEQGALPAFVETNQPFAKQSMSLIRMETPVIYFYPSTPMAVKVTASFTDGRFTEWYPAPTALKYTAAVWEGQLLPPHTPLAVPLPEVPKGLGDNYEAARAVPDAWYFQATPSKEKEGSKPTQTEKFIFYRGAGNAYTPRSVLMKGEEIVRFAKAVPGYGDIPAIVLQVRDGKARWKKVLAPESAEPIDPSFQVQMDKTTQPLDIAEKALSAEMVPMLMASGLSPDEAKAMVATWGGLWFREEGMRVLMLAPRLWVDQVLPMKIEPLPSKLTRVFLIRHEIVTPAQETAVLALLTKSGSSSPDSSDVKVFEDLRLGRFAEGILERAQGIQRQRMSDRFGRIRALAMRKETVPLTSKRAE